MREPHALSTTPSGNEALEKTTVLTVDVSAGVPPESDRMAAPAAAVTLDQELIDLATASVTDKSFEHCVVPGIHAGHGGSEV